MVVSPNTDRLIKQIQEKFNFKNNKWHDLDTYLDAKISKRLQDSSYIYNMTSREYINAVIKDVNIRRSKIYV